MTVGRTSEADPIALPGWPSVSVVVATRDRPELLRRAVERILAQRYEGELECIVVFDQSDPAPLQVDLEPGRRLSFVVNDRTPGLAGARNTGASVATGALLAFCDDDDEWMPGKLLPQIEALRSAPAAVVAACGIEVRYRGRSFARVSTDEFVTHRDLLRSRRMEIHPSCVLVRRRDFLERIGPVDESLPGSYAEDYEWLLRATRVGPIVTVPLPLVRVWWGTASWFEGRWSTIATALRYLLERYPEFREVPRGLARILGQIAFAHAALGERRVARGWARRSLAASWREPRAYLALAVSVGVVPASWALRAAHAFGKGI